MSYNSLLTLTPVLLEPVLNKKDRGGCLKLLDGSSISKTTCSYFEQRMVVEHFVHGCELCIIFPPHHKEIKTRDTIARPLDFHPLSSVPPHMDRNYFDYPFFIDAKSFSHLGTSEFKVMFIMRGLPGSGKSSIVNIIKSSFQNVVVCSADDYFLISSEDYKFDEQLLSAAHADCHQRAQQACRNKLAIVVVDNTNVKKWEMKFYVDLASRNGYVVVMVQPKTPWKWNAQELAARNKHGVSIDIIQRKIAMFDDVIPLYYGWFLSERKSKCLTNLCSSIYIDCISRLLGFKADLMKQLGISPGCNNKETAWRILSEYKSKVDEQNPLLHCTSMFCGRGKVAGAKEYHQQSDVQNSCSKVFTLTITGFVITRKTIGARVSLETSAASLFHHPEEREWRSHKQFNKEQAGLRFPTKNMEKQSKKNRKKAFQRKRKKNQKALPDKGNPFEEELEDTKEESLNVALFGDSFNKRLHDDDDEEDKKNELCISLEEVHSRALTLNDMFPLLNNSGFARSAHFTIKTTRGVESKEVNFDMLHVCDLEAAYAHDRSEFVPVHRGQACYYGDGICCVYFDKPLIVKTVFSGYY